MSEPKFKVVAYDFGVKRNILRILASKGCDLTLVPAQTGAAEVLAMQPDGVFLSNGPGDPEPCVYAIEAIRQFLDKNIPMFGICLGHQLMALASGAQTEKMIHVYAQPSLRLGREKSTPARTMGSGGGKQTPASQVR